jgi:hypothetical protein
MKSLILGLVVAVAIIGCGKDPEPGPGPVPPGPQPSEKTFSLTLGRLDVKGTISAGSTITPEKAKAVISAEVKKLEQ